MATGASKAMTELAEIAIDADGLGKVLSETTPSLSKKEDNENVKK